MSLKSRLADLTVAIREKFNSITPRVLPEGGDAGDILVKTSGNDFDTEWAAIGSWSPVEATGTGSAQQITLPETCTVDEIMVFVQGIFQHAGYSIMENILFTTQPAGSEILIVRYGAGVRGVAGADGGTTVEGVLGLTLALSGKADVQHSHSMDDIIGLQEELNDLADAGNKSYTWASPSSSTSWTITHNLGRYPAVVVIDSAGTQFFGTVNYIDLNTVEVNFSFATGGTAILI